MKRKYKTRIRYDAGEWSDERLLATAKAFKGLTEGEWWSRFDMLRRIGAKIKAETAITTPPPYILRALRDKDAKKLAAYMQRRGAEFEFKSWSKKEGIHL